MRLMELCDLRALLDPKIALHHRGLEDFGEPLLDVFSLPLLSMCRCRCGCRGKKRRKEQKEKKLKLKLKMEGEVVLWVTKLGLCPSHVE